jgi:signal peptidase I
MKTPCPPWLAAAGYRSIAYSLLLAAGLLFRSHYRFTIVSGDSMSPTLKTGNLLVVDVRAYDRAEPERGDIILTRYSKNLVVKRIVGLPGEEVEVRRGNLYINGRPVKENYRTEPGDLEVEKGDLYRDDFATLGDNREVPAVLAIHPIVTKAEILGKVVRVLGKQILR